MFARVASVLPDTGRFYLQTMVFGRNMIPLDEVDIDAPRESDAWYLALLGRQFPGSCLPFGQEQVVALRRAALPPRVELSGRLDYIETIRQWRKRFAAPSVRKTLLKLRLAAPLAHQRRLPARLHLGRERQQRVLRARAAGPLPARVREAGRHALSGVLASSRVAMSSAADGCHPGHLPGLRGTVGQSSSPGVTLCP